ncbi:MAG: hypothetical protein PHG85_06920, partial [Candidatus Altiarchaeota archaeon]|nr:hypothetical protein [Candidatus Altiarchaeota archaeon]
MAKPFSIFEVSYEVCNKVGGIYSLLKSKAPYMVREYGSEYLAVGPYMPDSAAAEFQEKDTPEDVAPVVDELLSKGIKCHCGVWLTEGRRNALLLDYSGYFHEANAIKKRLWEFAKVDSLYADSWFVDPLVWSTAVGFLLDRILNRRD